MSKGITTQQEALAALDRAWPHIVDECRAVLGSELHYQAVVYHCLRAHGEVPLRQIGMNVKMRILNSQTPLFRELDQRKAFGFQGGFEPTPDIVVFAPQIEGDWRRRNRERTLQTMLMAIEIKASERDKGRLQRKEVDFDIRKLHAHREEVRLCGADMLPVMMVIDTAPDLGERMRAPVFDYLTSRAQEHGVYFYYVAPAETRVTRPYA